MNNKKRIAEVLLEIAKNSKTEFIEDSAIDKEIKEAAKKIELSLPSPDLAVFKTVYCEIGKVNKNGVILSKKAVEKGLHTLRFKQLNWEHEGKGQVCGYTIDAKINGDRVETINVLFKSLFKEQFEELKEKIKTGEAAVSFEIWNCDPATRKSVVKQLDDGKIEIDPVIFHGTGVLLSHKPACPNAKIFKLVAKNEIREAEKIVNKIFSENLIFASFAIDDVEEANVSCECLKCGKVISTKKHCKDIKCPDCGGDMRRKDRPGEGQPVQESGKEKDSEEGRKMELEKLFASVEKEEDITFDLALSFYYASEEEQAKLTEDAAKWTRKFINSLPDSAFAAIEPAYPEKIQNKNARHLPHHNGVGDLGKDKSNANLDLPHYKNALARANQINPVSDSISAEELRAKANAHLERHKDVLEAAEKEEKPEEPKATEKTQANEVQKETKPEDKTDGAETTSAETPKAEETLEPKAASQEGVKPEEEKPESTEEAPKSEEAQDVETIVPKVVVKVTRIYEDVFVDTYVDGTPSGESTGKSYMKKITEYSDGTKDEETNESEYKKKFDYAELEKAVNDAKAEKDKEIVNLKDEHEKQLKEKDEKIEAQSKELDQKSQEIAKLKTEVETAEEKEDTPEMSVGSVEPLTAQEKSEIKQRKEKIDAIIASKHQNK
ncbi:MAG: hypothetical protein ACTSPI_12470 [Candidatus Heimdallarchaeaceae archaeon]